MNFDIADLKEKFDIKKVIADLRNSADQPSADPRMISALGAIGALLVILAIAVKAWDMWSGWTTAEASAAGHEVMEQLNEAVEPYRGIASDPEFLVLARSALLNPERKGALEEWLQNRIGHPGTVETYPGRVEDQVPEELGPNGFALASMMYIAANGAVPPLQIHNSLEPPQLVGLVRVDEEEQTLGFVSWSTDPAPILDAFNPEVSGEAYVALRQDYGRQSQTPLKVAGNAGSAPSQPDRMLVQGTLFRVEMPLHQSNELLPWARFLTVVIAGLLMFSGARFLQVKNKRWLAAQEAREAEQRRQFAMQAKEKAEQEEAAIAALALKHAQKSRFSINRIGLRRKQGVRGIR